MWQDWGAAGRSGVHVDGSGVHVGGSGVHAGGSPALDDILLALTVFVATVYFLYFVCTMLILIARRLLHECGTVEIDDVFRTSVDCRQLYVSCKLLIPWA